MAEVLIRLVNNTHDDPDLNLTECWKSGDVVCVRPDNHVWGNKETLPWFDIVTFPGVPVETLQAFSQSWLDQDGNMVRRSLYRYDFSAEYFENKDTGEKTYKADIN